MALYNFEGGELSPEQVYSGDLLSPPTLELMGYYDEQPQVPPAEQSLSDPAYLNPEES